MVSNQPNLFHCSATSLTRTIGPSKTGKKSITRVGGSLETLHRILEQFDSESESFLRGSPLGPDQLTVVQMWPACKECIENLLILYIVMYIAIALTNLMHKKH